MHLYIRYAPAAALLGIIMTRAFNPEFLAGKAFGPISWFLLLVVPLLYLTAWLLTPPVVQFVNVLGRRAFLLPVFFLVLVAGVVWTFDVLWNQAIGGICGTCPKSHLLELFTFGLFGA